MYMYVPYELNKAVSQITATLTLYTCSISQPGRSFRLLGENIFLYQSNAHFVPHVAECDRNVLFGAAINTRSCGKYSFIHAVVLYVI